MSIGYPDPKSQVKQSSSPGRAGILVVDEDPAFQLGLKTFLKEYVGFDRVFTARSGAEALDLIRTEESIEVITLDYEMPGMNGIEMLNKLESIEHRPLSILMITGYPSEELEAEFRAFESPNLIAADFISKPVEFEKLEPLVMKAHEELIAKKNASDDAPAIDPPVTKEPESVRQTIPAETEELEHTIAELEAKLSAQSIQLDELKKEVRSQQSRWRTDVFLIIFLAVATWLAAEFGLFESLRPKWNELKTSIRENILPIESRAPDIRDATPVAPEIIPPRRVPLPDGEDNPL